MIYGSVCSGIESASVAWEPLGFAPGWFSEIEAFPSAVLAHHWPRVANLGDMTALPGRIRGGEIVAPEILVGGTPCQAFSVAGKRDSLDDARGQLTLSYVEIANAIDDRRRQQGEQECITVWENVPGVLSTKDNAFGCFLAALVGESQALESPGKKWTNAGCVYGPQRAVAWRILDAQYFGVAQRRRRVFVVASARTGFDPAAVLFESDGVRRDTAPCRKTGPVVAALTAHGVGTCGADDNQGQAGHLVPHHTTGAGFWQEGFGTLRARAQDSHENLVAGTLTARYGRNGGSSNDDVDAGRLVVQHIDGGDVSRTLSARHDGSPCADRGPDVIAFSCKDNGRDAQVEVSPTLRAMNGEKPNGGGQLAVAFAENSRAELRLEGGDGSRTGALSTGGGKAGQGVPAVAFRACGQDGFTPSEIAPPVCASDGGGSGVPSVLDEFQVRRLTPVECERLQGFPDAFTLIPREKRMKIEAEQLVYLRQHWPELTEAQAQRMAADGPRYKAIGNSMAVPVVRWLGWRIEQVVLRAADAA